MTCFCNLWLGEKINLYCRSHPDCDILLWQPQLGYDNWGVTTATLPVLRDYRENTVSHVYESTLKNMKYYIDFDFL